MKRFITLLCMVALPFGILHSQDKSGNPLVNKINIIGNSALSDDLIRETMYTKKSRWWSKQRFEIVLLEDDLRSIITLYNNRGYLSAEIVNWDTTMVGGDKVNISIEVLEGAQSRTGTIQFTGNGVFPSSKLSELLDIKEGKPVSFLDLSRSTWNIINKYANAGYLDAQVQPILQREDLTIDIRYEIIEGDPIYADSLVITGTEKTREYVVRRELTIDKGDLLVHKKIIRSQQNLYKTGLFSSVSIIPVRDTIKSNYRDVRVELVEAETGELSLGVGYGSEELVRVSGELLHGNLAGTGQRAGIRGKVSLREIKGEILYTAPYFILGGVKFDNTTYVLRDREYRNGDPFYTLDRIGTESTIGKDVFRNSRLASSVKFENNYITRYDTAVIRDTSHSRTRSISLDYTRDTRRNLFNATSGSYLELSSQIAAQILSGTNSYLRLSGNYIRYLPYKPWITFAGNLSTGAIFGIGKNPNIPIFERFFAGGDQTIRGFREKSVLPSGGNLKLVLRSEVQFRVYKDLHTALFVDTGNIWKSAYHPGRLNLRTGYGCGILYRTPLGVARLDFGLKLDPREGETRGRIHLTVGQSI